MCGCCLSNSVYDKNLNSSLFGVPKTKNYNFNSLQVIDKNSKTCDYKKRYEYISTIGDGAFGLVRLFKDRECGLKYAIKTIKKDYINKYMIESLMREIDILSSLDHPNIVKYFETYEDSNYLHIVMEYIPGDNLFKMISNKKTIHFTEKDIHEIFVFLIKAVTFLHHNGIVHRDLKPENILFSVPGDYSSLKLIDFGLSIQRNLKTQAYRVGTPYYMAPEMIDGKYFFRSDVWSIGVILYTMITGSLPFNGSDKDEVFHKISLGNYDKKKLKEQNCSDELKDLIEKCLIVDRNKRITSDEILQHKWFKLFTKNPDYNTVLSPDIINALKNFQNQNVLQKEILYYLAKISTESEVVKLREAFSLIDEDNSGEIEYNDIPKVFQSLGIQATDEELKKIFDSLDFHHDGKVNYCEFIAATLSSIKFARKERLRSAFRYFDVSDQGYITADGIVEVLKKTKHIVNKDELIKIFSGLKGQKIEYEEFKKIFYETKAIPT
jgi:calcium-dependent protein kinase